MNWYEDEVKRVIAESRKISYNPSMIFYGSSSFTLWKTLHDDFKEYKPVNLGFGGSTLEACVFFYKRIMQALNPAHFIIYAGDNDLGDGKKPEVVAKYYDQLCSAIRESCSKATITYISIKPSIARWDIDDRIQRTNMLIKQHMLSKKLGDYFVNVYDEMTDKSGYPVREYYADDGLHLSQAGYALWKQTLLTHFSLNGYTNLTI